MSTALKRGGRRGNVALTAVSVLAYFVCGFFICVLAIPERKRRSAAEEHIDAVRGGTTLMELVRVQFSDSGTLAVAVVVSAVISVVAGFKFRPNSYKQCLRQVIAAAALIVISLGFWLAYHWFILQLTSR